MNSVLRKKTVTWEPGFSVWLQGRTLTTLARAVIHLRVAQKPRMWVRAEVQNHRAGSAPGTSVCTPSLQTWDHNAKILIVLYFSSTFGKLSANKINSTYAKHRGWRSMSLPGRISTCLVTQFYVYPDKNCSLIQFPLLTNAGWEKL